MKWMTGFILLWGFALAQAEPTNTPLNAVATVGMVGDVVETVGGDCVSVTTLMGPGIDPHLYKASASDVRTLQDAEVIFYAGYALEGQLGEVLEGFGRRTPTVAVAEAAVPRETLIETSSVYGVDPHLWMDVALWQNITQVIADELGTLRPDCAEGVQARAGDYEAKLAALNDWVGESVSHHPRRAARARNCARRVCVLRAGVRGSRSSPSRASAPRRRRG